MGGESGGIRGAEAAVVVGVRVHGEGHGELYWGGGPVSCEGGGGTGRVLHHKKKQHIPAKPRHPLPKKGERSRPPPPPTPHPPPHPLASFEGAAAARSRDCPHLRSDTARPHHLRLLACMQLRHCAGRARALAARSHPVSGRPTEWSRRATNRARARSSRPDRHARPPIALSSLPPQRAGGSGARWPPLAAAAALALGAAPPALWACAAGTLARTTAPRAWAWCPTRRTLCRGCTRSSSARS